MKKIAFLFFFTAFCFAQQPLLSLDKLWADEYTPERLKSIRSMKNGTHYTVLEERENGLIKNEDRPLKKRDHALFVGYAPVSNPKYAISVVVEHGGSGSSVAAPIARDVFKNMFKI